MFLHDKLENVVDLNDLEAIERVTNESKEKMFIQYNGKDGKV